MIIRLCSLAVMVAALVYLRTPAADYGAGLATLGAALLFAIGPMRILRFAAGLAMIFVAFG